MNPNLLSSSLLLRHLNSHSRVAGRSHLPAAVRGLCGLFTSRSDRGDNYVAARQQALPCESIRTGCGVGLLIRHPRQRILSSVLVAALFPAVLLQR